MSTSAAARQERIVSLAGAAGEVTVAALAERFGVSAMTIRRDLDDLDARGRLVRTHGGAMWPEGDAVEFAFQSREPVRTRQKRAIANAVVGLIRPGMTVTLDTGSTTLAVARRLGSVPGIKVLTSSLAVAAALYPYGQIELVLLGGAVRHRSPDLSGPLTEENLERFRVDVAVVGADAAGPEGVFTTHEDIARISARILAGAGLRVLAADASKFGARAFVRFAGWDSIDVVVSDGALSLREHRWLARANVTLIRAETEGDDE